MLMKQIEGKEIEPVPNVYTQSRGMPLNGNTATMIFNVAYLIAYCSQFMSLRTGDVISTGTPPGVGLGQKPPVYLRPGQTMRLGITGLGIQQQRTVAATAT